MSSLANDFKDKDGERLVDNFRPTQDRNGRRVSFDSIRQQKQQPRVNSKKYTTSKHTSGEDEPVTTTTKRRQQYISDRYP